SRRRGAQLRAHAGRVRRRADGRRQPARRHAHAFHFDLRPGAGISVRRRQPDRTPPPRLLVPRPRGRLRLAAAALVGVASVNNVSNVNNARNVSHVSDVRRVNDLNDASEASRALAVTVRKRLSPAFTLDISFSAPPGITIVFGESGSGKSTLLRTVAGLIEPDAGHIAIGERRLYTSAAGEPVP